MIKELAKKGLIDTELITVTGEKIGANFTGAPVPDGSVIRFLDNPYRPEGGLAILFGNLAPGGAAVKQGAVAPEMQGAPSGQGFLTARMPPWRQCWGAGLPRET